MISESISKAIMKKHFVIVLAALCAVMTVDAKVVLPHVLGDNMVLQRNTEVKLWGTANPGKKVTVTPSWGGAAVTVKA